MEKVFYFLFFPESQNLPLKFGKIEKNAKDAMGIRTPTHVDTRNRGTRPRPLGHMENLKIVAISC